MVVLSPEDKKTLGTILSEIDEIICAGMPDYVPNYTIFGDAKQGFGLAPKDDETKRVIDVNMDKLHPLYVKTIPILQKYHLNFQFQRKRESYALKSVEIFTFDGELVSKVPLGDKGPEKS